MESECNEKNNSEKWHMIHHVPVFFQMIQNNDHVMNAARSNWHFKRLVIEANGDGGLVYSGVPQILTRLGGAVQALSRLVWSRGEDKEKCVQYPTTYQKWQETGTLQALAVK